MLEKIGANFKIFSMRINGKKYYFVSSVAYKGFNSVYSDYKAAVKKFEDLEDYMIYLDKLEAEELEAEG